MSKIIVPLHFAKLTNAPNSVETGFKKFYLRGEWFKLYNGASEIDVVLDRPLDNYVPIPGTITSSDTVLTAIEKLDYAIGNINPNVLWGSITGNILAQTDLIAYIASLPASPLSALPFTTDHLSATNNQYVIGDLVWYLGNVYRCIANNDSIIPTSTLYWTNLGAGYPIVQQPADWNSTSGNNQILNKPTIPTTPSLQQVTTVGAITTDAITVGGIYSGNLYSDGYNFGISDNYDTNYNLLYQPFVGLEITNTSDHVYIYQDASIGFQNFAGGYGNLRSDLVTGSWSWQLPDASGTLALTSNIGTWGALNYPTWVSGTPFVKMIAAGTFVLDTTTYYPYPTGTISQYIRGDGTLATFPSVATPTLQQVTTAGNTTTDSIFLQTGVSPLEVILSHSYISLTNTLTGKSVTISTNNDVTFSDGGGNFLYLKSPATILGTNTQTLQNASGTVALLSDIPAGGVTSVTATSPITSSGGTTPVISTSMSTNKLIGRSTAGTGVMEEITIGTGLTLSGGTLTNTATYTSPLTTKGDIFVRNATIDTRLPVGLDTQILLADSSTATGLKWGTNTAATPTGYYGAFSDVTDQFAAVINTGYPMLLGVTDLSNGITVVSGSRVTIANTGIYNIQWSAQFRNPTASEQDVTIWLRKNGVDVPGSAGVVSVPKKHGSLDGHTLPSWNFLLDPIAGDYYEFVWSTVDTSVYINFEAAGSPPPSTASVVLTVTQQSGIMAGTGITAINTLTGSVQTLVTGTSGTNFAISSSGTTHTFNLPTASAINRGALSSTDWNTFNAKPNLGLVQAMTQGLQNIF